MPFTEGICLPIQQALTETAGTNAPMLKRDRVGYLEALLSPANQAGVKKVSVPSDGKRRRVEVIYMPRGLETDVEDGQPLTFCDADSEAELLSEVIDVTKWKHRKMRLSEDDLRRICFETADNFGAQLMLSQMNAILTAVNRDILAVQQTRLGRFIDGSSVKQVSLLDVNRAPVYYAESLMLEEYARISGSGLPLIIGAGDMAHYTRMSDKGCCNPAGINMNMAGDFAFFYDRFVDPVFDNGEENYLMLAPGAVHFLVWNANVGDYARQNDREEIGTLVDPFTGIPFDVDIIYDPCVKRYNFTLSLNYDLFFLPDDSFAAGDDLAGVNYTLRFEKG